MAVLRDDWDWARYLGSLRWDVTDKDGNPIPLAVDVRRGCDAVERIDLMVHSAYVKPFDVKVPVLSPQDASELDGVLHTLLERVMDGVRRIRVRGSEGRGRVHGRRARQSRGDRLTILR